MSIAMTVVLAANPVPLTQEEIVEVAGIVAGESIPGLPTSYDWVAWAVMDDLRRGYTVATLRPNRWRGWRKPLPEHIAAVERAAEGGDRGRVPQCVHLGNGSDYDKHWSHLPNPTERIVTESFEMVCVVRTQTRQVESVPEEKVKEVMRKMMRSIDREVRRRFWR